MNLELSKAAAERVAGTLGFPSKMPGTSYGIPAQACITGSKLADIEGSVCHGCYALKGNYLYPDVMKGQAKRLAGIASPLWVKAIVSLLRHTQRTGKGRGGKPIERGFHRWHDAGDIQSVEHLARICQVAELTPEIQHWLPTRELGIVRDYKGVIPSNLTIRVSATMVDGPATKAWPTTSGVHKRADSPAGSHDCPASKQDGKCGPCRACWSKEVKHVSYPFHN